MIRIFPMVGKSTVMFPMCVVKCPMIEISGVVSVEEGAIVFKINPVVKVTIPGRIIIICIAGEICFVNGGSGIVAIRIDRSGCRCIDNGCGDRGADINVGNRNTDTNMRTDDYLRIAFAGDEAGGYNGGKDK